jgi:hypothetical protein
MHIRRLGLSAALVLTLFGCRAEGESDPVDGADGADGADGSAEWEELGDEETDGTKDDGTGGSADTGKDGYRACGDEVVAGAPCEGSWEETLCVDDSGSFWWCEDGAWTSDKDR